MWIFVKSGLAGAEKKRIDNIKPTDKVEHLKVLLAEALGMEVRRMRVFHKGKTLEDGHQLHEYSIKQDETLQVFPRPPTPTQEPVELSAPATIGPNPTLTTELSSNSTTQQEDNLAPSTSAEPVEEANLRRLLLREISSSDDSVADIMPQFQAVNSNNTINRNKKDNRADSDTDSSGPDIIPGTRVFTPISGSPSGRKLRIDYSAPRTTDYDEEELRILQSLGDACDKCIKYPKRDCKTCGCYVCGGKDDEDMTLVCDECEMYYHCRCLDPPLTKLPDEEWFCPQCKNDNSHIILPGQKLPKPASKGKAKADLTKPNKPPRWGNGNANVGRTKTCTIVGQHHVGAIPGVEVGQTWLFRMQVSESGVHRPPVGGISGSAKVGSQSIVLAGGYKEDVDNGDSFLYTGSGGRDVGTGRTAKAQSCDQTLTSHNAALALTCDAPVSESGAVAGDWRKSKPVRVVRGYKMRKHSDYAPEKGFRYDGLYKLVRYWQEKGTDGYIVIRYEFRRDDPSPAPWTEEGKKRIEELGLEMIYPDNYVEKPEKPSSSKKRGASAANGVERASEASMPVPEAKKFKKVWSPPADLLALIAADSQPNLSLLSNKASVSASQDNATSELNPSPTEEESPQKPSPPAIHSNSRLWTVIASKQPHNKSEYVSTLAEELKCPVCFDFVQFPVTTACGHNVCRACLRNSVQYYGLKCPSCRTALEDGAQEKVNERLVKIVRYFGNEEYSMEK